MENLQFDKSDGVYKKLTMLLIECQEFENTEEYPLIRENLSKTLGLINDIRVKSLKDPLPPD